MEASIFKVKSNRFRATNHRLAAVFFALICEFRRLLCGGKFGGLKLVLA